MKFFRKFVFGPSHGENYHPDYRGLDRLVAAWSATSSPDHRMPHGAITLPYGHPDCDRLIELYLSVTDEFPLEWTLDALDIWYESAIQMAPLLSVEVTTGHEIPEAEFKRRFCIRESADGRSFADQVAPLRIDLRQSQQDFMYVEHAGLTLALVVSARARFTLEAHDPEAAFLPVCDAATGGVTGRYFQLSVRCKLPVDETRTKLINELQPFGDKRLYPGTFLDFFHDVRDRDLYFHPTTYGGQAIFLTEQFLGPGKWLNDSRRMIVISAALRRSLETERITGLTYQPAYVVDDRIPVGVWGGTLLYEQEKYFLGSYADWFDAKVRVFEQFLGKMEPDVYSSRVPLHLGGESSLFVFKNWSAAPGGVTYVTSDLIGMTDQRPNSSGQYELMMCARDETDWIPNFLARLAKHSLGEVLEPGDTMDIAPAVPKGSTIAALLFTNPELGAHAGRLDIRGAASGILLCIGITARELAVCRAGNSSQILAGLKRAEVFPFTDLARSNTDLG